MNVIVAGGKEDDLALLKGMGVNVLEHWNNLRDMSFRSIPKEAELAVVVADKASVLLVRQLEDRCKREGVPMVKTGQSWDKFSEALLNPEKFLLDKDDGMPYNQTGFRTHKEKTMNKNTERAEQKKSLIRQIFAADKFARTEDVQAKVINVFGKGVTPAVINELRVKEFRVKAGPRGIFTDPKGKRIHPDATPAAKSPQLAASEPIGDVSEAFNGPSPVKADLAAPELGQSASSRISQLVSELRSEMDTFHVRQLSIPLRGQVRAVYEAQLTLQ